MSKVMSGAAAVIAAFMATMQSGSQAKVSEDAEISSARQAPAISDAAAEVIKAKAERPERIAADEPWKQIRWNPHPFCPREMRQQPPTCRAAG
jgi:hypothetical protein